MILKPIPLTAANFSPYGDVLEAKAAREIRKINYGHTLCHHDLAKLDLTAEGGTPTVSIFRTEPLPRPIHIRVMERHLHGSQTFFPLHGRPYLVVVAAPGEFKTSNLKAFLASSDQGVNYRRGTWHHYNLALEKTSDFLVLDRTAPKEDCVEITVPASEQITIDY